MFKAILYAILGLLLGTLLSWIALIIITGNFGLKEHGYYFFIALFLGVLSSIWSFRLAFAEDSRRLKIFYTIAGVFIFGGPGSMVVNLLLRDYTSILIKHEQVYTLVLLFCAILGGVLGRWYYRYKTQ